MNIAPTTVLTLSRKAVKSSQVTHVFCMCLLLSVDSHIHSYPRDRLPVGSVVNIIGVYQSFEWRHRKFRGHNFDSCVTNFDNFGVSSSLPLWQISWISPPHRNSYRGEQSAEPHTHSRLSEARGAQRGGAVGGWVRRWRDCLSPPSARGRLCTLLLFHAYPVHHCTASAWEASGAR